MASQVSRQIGANIRAARKAKGLTQGQLGRLIGTENFQVSRWERGEHRPTDESMHALAQALELDYIDFFAQPEREAA